jgi:hypothetical protein
MFDRFYLPLALAFHGLAKFANCTPKTERNDQCSPPDPSGKPIYFYHGKLYSTLAMDGKNNPIKYYANWCSH